MTLFIKMKEKKGESNSLYNIQITPLAFHPNTSTKI